MWHVAWFLSASGPVSKAVSKASYSLDNNN